MIKDTRGFQFVKKPLKEDTSIIAINCNHGIDLEEQRHIEVYMYINRNYSISKKIKDLHSFRIHKRNYVKKNKKFFNDVQKAMIK